MPTNKETFNINMNNLANTINTKAGLSGLKTIIEMKSAVDNLSPIRIVASEDDLPTTASDGTIGIVIPSFNVTIANGMEDGGGNNATIEYQINGNGTWVTFSNLSSTVNLTNVETIQFRVITFGNAPETYFVTSTTLGLNLSVSAMSVVTELSSVYTLSQNVADIIVGWGELEPVTPSIT